MNGLRMYARALLLTAGIAFAGVAHAQQVKLTLWTHWAAEKIKREYVEDAIKRFEAANPNVKIEAQWYEKTALYAALKTALRAGTAPDIFYAEPDQVEYMDNGLLLDLSPLNWSAIEPWAKEIWTYKGKPYGLPLEAWTVELYYNKKLMDELGIKVPSSLQLDTAAFTEMIKKARARNLTPMALGVGDRPFPGAHLTHEALLKKLGTADYGKLLKGELSWSDPRVVDTLKLVRSMTEAGLLPATFTTLKLGEAHTYFHTNPGAVSFLNGSWYTSRAFNPPDKGGQPAKFPLGVMKYPAIPGAACNECRTIAVGGSYVANAGTKHSKEVIAFLNSFAQPEMAARWLEQVLVQTGIKADYAKVGGPYAGYFRELGATSAGAKYYFGLPMQKMQGKPKEVFTQVFNNAFPAGAISVDDAVKQMNSAFGK
ncbi:MAG: extracellular solute-binding protein [Burkholderiaceae bacterium]|nr:extracellular solute-binding protein [Burkholderiaceae bacterium]